MTTISSIAPTILVALGLLIASAPVQAKVYKCTINGNITYSDLPCESAEKEAVKPVPAPSPPAADTPAGPGWRLAGGYTDHVKDPSATQANGSKRTVKRSSYGIECEVSGRRPFVYAINNRYTLIRPDHNGKKTLQGPFFDTLEAAAAAACAAK